MALYVCSQAAVSVFMRYLRSSSLFLCIEPLIERRAYSYLLMCNILWNNCNRIRVSWGEINNVNNPKGNKSSEENAQ